VADAIASSDRVFLGCLSLIIIVLVNAVQVPIDSEHTGCPGVRLTPRLGWLSAYQVILTVVIVPILVAILTSLVAWFMAHRAVCPLTNAPRLQRDFIADANHELRTLLTALSSKVQILEYRLRREPGPPPSSVCGMR